MSLPLSITETSLLLQTDDVNKEETADSFAPAAAVASNGVMDIITVWS